MSLKKARDFFERARINSKGDSEKQLADGLAELAKSLNQRLNNLESRVNEVQNEIRKRK